MICPDCGAIPPVERWANENYKAYGHRKWRWLSNHIVTEHTRQQATTFLHRQAVKEGKAKLKETRFAGKRTSAA